MASSSSSPSNSEPPSRSEFPSLSTESARQARNKLDTIRRPLETTTQDNWPKFLVIKGTDSQKPLLKQNETIIRKAIEGIAGKVTAITAMRSSGLLLIEAGQKHHATNLLKAKFLHDIPIEVSKHRTLNTSKGVISSRHTEDMTTDELQEHLEPQGVTNVERIMTKKSGNLEPTNTLILTFDSPQRPSHIHLCWERLKVRVYIPNPRRCFNCQRYGHGKNNCRNQTVCSNCGQEGHDHESCSNEAHCYHCEEAHATSSRACPQWALEKQILTIKYTEDISFQEARARVLKPVPKPSTSNNSYAKTATKSTCSIATQTQVTWPKHSEDPCIIINEEGEIISYEEFKRVAKQIQKSKDTKNDTNEIEMEVQTTNTKRDRETSDSEESLPEKVNPPKKGAVAGGAHKEISKIPSLDPALAGRSGLPVERRNRPPIDRKGSSQPPRSSSPVTGKSGEKTPGKSKIKS